MSDDIINNSTSEISKFSISEQSVDPVIAKKIISKYGNLFNKPKARSKTSFSVYGFEHATGWTGIIDGLCATLTDHCCQTSVVQIKQKLGGLRFYVETELDDFESGACEFAELFSYRICEISGYPGILHVNKSRWFRTICNEIAINNEFTRSRKVTQSMERSAFVREYQNILETTPIIPNGLLNLVDRLLYMLNWEAQGKSSRFLIPRDKMLIIHNISVLNSHFKIIFENATERELGIIACARQLALRINPVSGRIQPLL